MLKIVIFGVFDYFHLGHLRLFKQAKEKADYLIVAVQDSNYVKKFKPDVEVFYSTEQRVELLKSIKEIDEIIIYKEATPELLDTLEFDILGLGEDQKNERFDKLIFWCKEHNKKMVRLKRTKNISSTKIKLNLKR